MQNKSGKTSDEDSAPPEGSSVYDFLYYDGRRIASYLSQLGQYGVPTKVRHQQRTSSGSTQVAGGEGQLGVPGVAAGKTNVQNAQHTDVDETLDQEYDPIWLGGLTLHDELAQRGLIKTELTASRIGDFVDIEGALSVVDFTIFQKLWHKQSIQGLIQIGIDQAAPPAEQLPVNRHDRRQRQRQTATQPSREASVASQTTGNLVGDLLSALPHPVQGRLLTEQHQAIWTSLRGDSLVIEASDVFLKHGIALDGRWRMFGVLDALPNTADADPLKVALGLDFASAPFGQIALGMLPLLSAGFSRQDAAWGMTPIMVFRELNVL